MDELKTIKKIYGEKMAHLCRELFPVILEQPGKLLRILEENFNSDKKLYYDLTQNNENERIKSYIYNLAEPEREKKITINKNPKEILELVGYNFYECETVEDLNKFKSYYKENEVICTYRDGPNGENRLKTNHIFFAVKKDVDKIKRGENPRREDDYGVSVISIQISKEKNWLSIKNRYNHTVPNPDATFSNNLDNIIPGLTQSFNDTYKLSIDKEGSRNLELPNYIKANDGKFYRYNREINNIYYCPGNIVINNGEVKTFDKSKTRVIDQFIINKGSKTEGILPSIENIDVHSTDSFINTFGKIEKITELKKKNEQGEKYIEIIIHPKDENHKNIFIKVDEGNNIIGYKNENITKIQDDFMEQNMTLTEIDLPNLKTVGDYFIRFNESLKKLDLPNLKTVGNCFVRFNQALTKIDLPNLETVGDSFVCFNKALTEIKLTKLKTVGDNFMTYNKSLTKIDLPNLETIGDGFLSSNPILSKKIKSEIEEREGEQYEEI